MLSKFCLLLYFFAFMNAQAFEYKITKDYRNPSVLSLARFDLELAELGFYGVDPSNNGDLPFANLDQAFFNFKGSKSIYIKFGIAPVPFKEWERLAAGFVFHGKTQDNVDIAVLFENFSEQEAKDIRLLMFGETAEKKAEIFSLKISSANANPCVECDRAAARRAPLPTYATMFDQQALMSCAIAAMEGAGHSLQSTGNQIAAIANDPAAALASAVAAARGAGEKIVAGGQRILDDPQAFWQKNVEMVKNIRQSLAQLQQQAGEFFETWAALDPTVLRHMVCSVAGSLASDILIGAAATAVVGAGAVMAAKIAHKFSKLLEAKNLFMSVNQLHRSGKAGDLSRLVRTCVECTFE
jgi:hypothetical protein